MGKYSDKVRKIWLDPVGSKVIASGIVAIVSLIVGLIVWLINGDLLERFRLAPPPAVHYSDRDVPSSEKQIAESKLNSSVIYGDHNVVNQTFKEKDLPAVTARPVDERTRLLVGRWKGVQRMSVPRQASLLDTGFAQFTESGHYNYTGEQIWNLKYGGDNFELVYSGQAAGLWNLNGSKLEVVVSDVKSQLRDLRIDGKSIPNILQLTSLPNAPRVPKLEDMTPVGASLEYEIVELNRNNLRLKRQDIRGITSTYEGTRN